MTRAAIAETDQQTRPALLPTTRASSRQSNRSWHIAATEMRRPDVHLYALDAAPNDHCWPHATDAELHAENG
jgi:hypothetical protein